MSYYLLSRSEYKSSLELAIFEAERKGSKEVKFEIKARNFFDDRDKLEVGQIIHYNKPDGERKIHPKNIWCVTSVSSSDGFDRNVTYTLELQDYIKEEDYLPKNTFTPTTEEVKAWTDEARELGFNVGEYFINKEGLFVKFCGVTTRRVPDNNLTHNSPLKNPNRVTIYKDEIVGEFLIERDFSEENSEENWREDHFNLDSMKNLDVVSIGYDCGKFKSEVKQIAEGGIDAIKPTISIGSTGEETGRELVGFASKDHLQAVVKSAEEKTKIAKSTSRGLIRESSFRMREVQKLTKDAMAKVEEVKAYIVKQIKVLDKVIIRMNKLITTLELYAGIKEDLVQIQEGEGSKEGKLHLRQKTVYLDEEMAIYEDQGLEMKDIEDFDKWLLDDSRYKELLPEEMCVVSCRVRRNNKKYGWIENPFVRGMAEAGTNAALLLFRNGDNVYRIYTPNLGYTSRLFPLRSELKSMFDTMEEAKAKLESTQSSYEEQKAEQTIETVEDTMFNFQKAFFLIHGVLSRTTIFHPVPHGINIMKPETYGDFVHYVYDDEMMLNPNTETFKEWREKKNEGLAHGCRIYLSKEVLSNYGNKSSEDWSERYNKEWNQSWQRPNLPPSGVYLVKKEKVLTSSTNGDYFTEEQILEGVYGKDGKRIWFDKINRYKREDDKVLYWVNIPFPDGSIYKEEVVEKLRISFNESDSERDRFTYEVDRPKGKVYTTFEVKKTDDFIICLDDVDVDDLDRHANDKSQRHNYLAILPALMGLKNMLLKEFAQEREFAEAMSSTLSLELGLNEEFILNDVLEAIDWYKNKLAISLKRPLLTGDGLDTKKAWELVSLQAKRSLKKKHKLSLDVSGLNKEGAFKYSTEISLSLTRKNWITKKVTVVANVSKKSEAVDLIFGEMKKIQHDRWWVADKSERCFTKKFIKASIIPTKAIQDSEDVVITTLED